MQTNYQMWYRPQGSTTYTPWGEGGWVRVFLTEEQAREFIALAKSKFTNEFAVFKCIEQSECVELNSGHSEKSNAESEETQ